MMPVPAGYAHMFQAHPSMLSQPVLPLPITAAARRRFETVDSSVCEEDDVPGPSRERRVRVEEPARSDSGSTSSSSHTGEKGGPRYPRYSRRVQSKSEPVAGTTEMSVELA
jgi:hypothetical protein